MANKIDHTGKRYGRLIARAFSHIHTNRAAMWLCDCDCGTKGHVVRGSALSDGKAKSCGCLKVDAKTTHGHSRNKQKPTREYVAWANMIQRCFNDKHPAYEYYGGRGITVCERWRKFENFFADMGRRPLDKTLDRRDNNGHYNPGNCRWATMAQQNANKRRVNHVS